MNTRAGALTKGWAIAILVLGWFILCKPWIIDHRAIPWDNKDVFYPFASFISNSIRSGQSPFWNPYVYGGYPMISDPQSMMFSPVSLVLMLAVEKPSFYWFDIIELLHLLIGGLGMLLLSIRLGRSPPAALFSAAIFMFGGSASARMQHVPMIYAYAYFPFALLALEEMLSSNRKRWAICFGLVAGIMAAHMNQVAYLLSLFLIGYYVHRAISSESLRWFVASRWQVSVLAAISGALVLAIPMFLVFQFLPFSNRTGIPYEVAISGSMDPASFLSLMFRNFYGSGRAETYWGPWDITEGLYYAGTLPIVLVLRYGLADWALLDRRFRYFTAVGIISILYAIGNWTPFYWIVYHLVPGVSLYRRPSDATFVLNIVLALAVGYLIDRLLITGPGRIPRVAFWMGLTTFTALLAWGLHYAWEFHKLRWIIRDCLWAVVFVSTSLWLLRAIASAHSERKQLWLTLSGILLLAVDFGVHTAGSHVNATFASDFPLLMSNSEVNYPVARFLRSGLESDRALGPFRAEIVLAGAAWSNAPMLVGVQSAQGYNPLTYRLYDRVAIGDLPSGSARTFSHLMPGYDSPLMNLLGVKYILSYRPLQELDPRTDEKRFPMVLDQGFHVWQNPDVLPRIIAATSIYVEPELDRAIDTGPMAPLDYRSAVVLSHIPDTLSGIESRPRVVTELPGLGEPNLRMVRYENTQVMIDVETNRDIILELNDPYYFAWHVYVDGQERELLQANYLFRGVHIKRGERHVLFRFEPFSWSTIGRSRSGRATARS